MDKPQLFLLHFAGGNCYSYNFMSALLKNYELFPIELPGRGKRIKEALLKDFDLAAEDVYDQILPKLKSSKFLIYGHSMGSHLALRVCNMLEKQGLQPLYIIVSGNPGPGISENKRRYLMENNEFIEELQKLGGVPKEVIEDKELLNYFEPILRADFEISEKNEIAMEKPVNCPIFAIMGNEEENVSQIENWKKYTKSHFDYAILEGNHFFIHSHPKEIARAISICYDRASVSTSNKI